MRTALQTDSPPFMPPKMDATSDGLVLPQSRKAGVTAFVEPTVSGGGCILFVGRMAERSSDNDGETETTLCAALLGNDPSVAVA